MKARNMHTEIFAGKIYDSKSENLMTYRYYKKVYISSETYIELKYKKDKTSRQNINI